MSAWERLVYVASLAFWRAFFEYRDARRLAVREVVTDEDRARAARFRAAVDRVLLERAGGAGRDGAPPAGG